MRKKQGEVDNKQQAGFKVASWLAVHSRYATLDQAFFIPHLNTIRALPHAIIMTTAQNILSANGRESERCLLS